MNYGQYFYMMFIIWLVVYGVFIYFNDNYTGVLHLLLPLFIIFFGSLTLREIIKRDE